MVDNERQNNSEMAGEHATLEELVRFQRRMEGAMYAVMSPGGR